MKNKDESKLPESVHYHGYTVYSNGRVDGLYGKPIKARLNNGRYEVRLNIDGERKNFILSRLVYHAFHPFNLEDKNLCVTYRDGDKENVDLSNLILVNRKDLIQGDKHIKQSSLTNEQAAEIIDLHSGKSGSNQYDKTGYSYQDLAKMYGVSKGNIAMIVKGRSRKSENYKLK